jgi:hypothetical protein
VRILAQRAICRAAGDAGQEAVGEAERAELAADVYRRLAAMAGDAMSVAQQHHQASLNELWALEARRG